MISCVSPENIPYSFGSFTRGICFHRVQWQWVVDRNQWAVSSGQWQWIVESNQWEVGSGQLQWIVDSNKWAVGSDSNQWAVDNRIK
jgi:hypothetical protein